MKKINLETNYFAIICYEKNEYLSVVIIQIRPYRMVTQPIPLYSIKSHFV